MFDDFDYKKFIFNLIVGFIIIIIVSFVVASFIMAVKKDLVDDKKYETQESSITMSS